MTAQPGPGHLNVIIVGAGLSGIGAACHLQRNRPGASVAILEARAATGGTWDQFRYPGVRSDSDMFTLGYSFRPWSEPEAIAGGSSILTYLRETAAEYRVDERIRLNHRVTAASWDSESARWTVTVAVSGEAEPVTMTCDLLWMCTGYYSYDEGHLPDFPGIEDFKGSLIHPQRWPADLDYAGKRVVVIGSGATAMTLVPAMADTAEHVTMLQRSPTYVVAAPDRNPIADAVRKWLPAKVSGTVNRWLWAVFGVVSYQLCRRRPTLVKSALLKAVQRQLPAGYDVGTHFTPSYNPWDQRMCLITNGDLFTSIRDGKVSVVTDTIERFTRGGIRLTSGDMVVADVVVSATGLSLLALGGTEITVDGRRVDTGSVISYKGMMLSGVPNFAWTFGYTNASWTLKADLVASYVCRLLAHMDKHGYEAVTPVPPATGAAEPFLDLTANYVKRSIDLFPKQGAHAPWRLYQNYLLDYRVLSKGPVDDYVLFTPRKSSRVRERITA